MKHDDCNEEAKAKAEEDLEEKIDKLKNCIILGFIFSLLFSSLRSFQ